MDYYDKKNYFKFYYILGSIIQKLEYEIPLSDIEQRFLFVVEEYDYYIEEYELQLKQKQ